MNETFVKKGESVANPIRMRIYCQAFYLYSLLLFCLLGPLVLEVFLLELTTCLERDVLSL